jgi:mannose-6-phosphate isomerase-like protein (cupin superfamily)
MLVSRRKALSAAIATLAGSALPEIGGAEQTAPDTGGESFVVRKGQGRAGSPWVIRGATPIMAKISGSDLNGRLSVIEVNTPSGRGPELHMHLDQNETFFVLRGRIGVMCGTERTVLEVGDTLMAPKQIPHAYVALGSETAGILNIFDPAGAMEDFFAAYTSILNSGGPPDPQKMAAAYAAHGMKMLGKPLVSAMFA